MFINWRKDLATQEMIVKSLLFVEEGVLKVVEEENTELSGATDDILAHTAVDEPDDDDLKPGLVTPEEMDLKPKLVSQDGV